MRRRIVVSSEKIQLVAEGVIKSDEDVVAVLTGHLLKDTDYVIKYHNQTLTTSWGSEAENERLIVGHFSNPRLRVSASREALSAVLERLQGEHGGP